MLFQLHWQDGNPQSPTYLKTEFVAQDEANDQEGCNRILERFREIIERRKSECPHEWGPMICDEGYSGFMLVADEPVTVGN